MRLRADVGFVEEGRHGLAPVGADEDGCRVYAELFKETAGVFIHIRYRETGIKQPQLLDLFLICKLRAVWMNRFSVYKVPF